MTIWERSALGAALLVGVAIAAGAQTASTPPAADTGPQMQDTAAAERPVARLSHRAGTVSVAPEDGTAAAVDAPLNMPLLAGTRLSTGDDGEAEVEFADGSVLRLTPRSEATLARLDPSVMGMQVELGNGLFYLELRASDRGTFAVLAGEVTVTPEENASFRVRVQDAQVETAVLMGSVSVTQANAYSAQIDAGESLRTDPKNGKRYLLAQTVPPEQWDHWNEKLSQAAQDEQAARTAARDSYAGQQGYGWADLDAAGQWYDVPGEGEVWQPTLADASFDPYGSGAWVYAGGGYTWASAYGWGWLPYRCGAWSYYNGFGWGWVPSIGCGSFGFNGGGGAGGRVRHAPTGWHPPHRPVPIAGEPLHPPVPVRQQAGSAPPEPIRRTGVPPRIAGVVARPLPRVGRPVTPQGGSAVGSALLRDFPVRAGTHEAVLGTVSQGIVAVPGRAAVWHAHVPVVPAGVREEPGISSAPAGFAASSAGRTGNGHGQGTLPKPTDPPLGANGRLAQGAAVPTNANGPVPVGGNGRPGVQSTTPTATGGSAANGLLPRGGRGEGVQPVPVPQRYLPAPVVVPRAVPAPVVVPRAVPAPVVVPRATAPPAVVPAPRVAPTFTAPVAPAVPSATTKIR